MPSPSWQLGAATAILLSLGSGSPAPAAEHVPGRTTLIVNARVVDGTGARGPAAPRVGSTATASWRSAHVAPHAGEEVVDAGGLTLAPGLHRHPQPPRPAACFDQPERARRREPGHHDHRRRPGRRLAPAAGRLLRATREDAARRSTSPRTSGTTTLRARHGRGLRARRPPPRSTAMRSLSRARHGGRRARPLEPASSTTPGSTRTRAELIALAHVAAATAAATSATSGARTAASGTRSTRSSTIGRAAKLPVQVSHVKLAMTRWWGQAPRLLGALDAARAQRRRRHRRRLSVPLLAVDPHRAVSRSAISTNLAEAAEFARGDRAARRAAPDGVTLRSRPTSARPWPRSPPSGTRHPSRDPDRSHPRRRGDARGGKEDVENVIATSMVERRPRGAARLAAHQPVHRRRARRRPPARLRHLPAGAAAATCASAGARARGGGAQDDERSPPPTSASPIAARLAPGAFADLVLFDPATVLDRVHVEDPHALSVGHRERLGQRRVVFADEHPTGAASRPRPAPRGPSRPFDTGTARR